jgi:predicted ABC-type ATPase
VAARQSFTYETVMSSGDKVDLLEHARSLGYRTYTYFVCTDRPDINVGRVAYRVSQGGHHVPVDKIVARYGRSLQHLPRAIASSDRAYLFDNSDVAHRLIAEYDAGTLIATAKSLPAWFIASVLNARPLP